MLAKSSSQSNRVHFYVGSYLCLLPLLFVSLLVFQLKILMLFCSVSLSNILYTHQASSIFPEKAMQVITLCKHPFSGKVEYREKNKVFTSVMYVGFYLSGSE